MESAGDVGRYTSLALDGDGYAHIAYYNQTDFELDYARWTGSDWVTRTVETGFAGTGASLALDDAGTPHMSYIAMTGGFHLKYARWNGATWDIQPVGEATERNVWTSLALDGSGVPHIAYFYENGSEELRYARWTGSTWDVQTVVDGMTPWTGRRLSMALDGTGEPHISYYAEKTSGRWVGSLNHVHWTGDDWRIAIVDRNGDVGLHSALTLDEQGFAHIGYYGATNADLKYAVAGPPSQVYLPLVLSNVQYMERLE